MTCPLFASFPLIFPLFCELSFALIGNEFYSALCFLVLLKKLIKVFLVFIQFVFECRFYSSLNFLWCLWSFRVHDICSSCVVKKLGNFLLRVVPGILPAIFFTSSNFFFALPHFAAFSTFCVKSF